MANENGRWQSESRPERVERCGVINIGPETIKFKILERIAIEGESPVKRMMEWTVDMKSSVFLY